MNYNKIYENFIADRKNKEIEIYSGKTYRGRSRIGSNVEGKYYEHHHILPVSLGGTKDSENIVSLSAGDHYFAHLCLAKIYSGNQWFGVIAMAFLNSKTKKRDLFCKRKMVSVAREKKALAMTGVNHYLYGKHLSCKTKEKISVARKKLYANGMVSTMKGKTHTKEVLAKISKTHKGRKHSIIEIENNSKRNTGCGNGMFGKKHTIESLQKISESRKGKLMGKSNPMSNDIYKKRQKDAVNNKSMQKLRSKKLKETLFIYKAFAEFKGILKVGTNYKNIDKIKAKEWYINEF